MVFKVKVFGVQGRTFFVYNSELESQLNKNVLDSAATRPVADNDLSMRGVLEPLHRTQIYNLTVQQRPLNIHISYADISARVEGYDLSFRKRDFVHGISLTKKGDLVGRLFLLLERV